LYHKKNKGPEKIGALEKSSLVYLAFDLRIADRHIVDHFVHAMHITRYFASHVFSGWAGRIAGQCNHAVTYRDGCLERAGRVMR